MPKRIDQFTKRRKLRKTSKSAVFRLHGVAEDGANLIAKRGNRGPFEIERFVYGDLLPQLDIPSIRLIGWIDTVELGPWLFLEDAGDDIFIKDDPGHLRAAAEWLARMHTGLSRHNSLSQLPGRDARYYGGMLASALEMARRVQAEIPLTGAQTAVLEEAEKSVAALEGVWPDLAARCERMPVTFAHADFVPKNLRVTTRPDGALDVFVFDWEMAGAGPPAVDLPGIHLDDDTTGFDSYSAIACARWRGITKAEVKTMLHVGEVFRYVAAFHWACEQLRKDKSERPLRNIQMYSPRLRQLADSL